MFFAEKAWLHEIFIGYGKASYSYIAEKTFGLRSAVAKEKAGRPVCFVKSV